MIQKSAYQWKWKSEGTFKKPLRIFNCSENMEFGKFLMLDQSHQDLKNCIFMIEERLRLKIFSKDIRAICEIDFEGFWIFKC